MYKKRFLGVLLAFMIAAGSVPAAVSAGDADMNQPVVSDTVSQETENTVTFENAQTVYSEKELRNAVAIENNVITLGSDITLSNMLTIAQNVTIYGAGHRLSAAFSSAANIVKIIAGDKAVTISNVVLENTANAKHAINVYKSTNVTLDAITVKNLTNGLGLVVNASQVKATGNWTFENNVAWGTIKNAINVGWGKTVTMDKCVFDASEATFIGVQSIYTGSEDYTNAGNTLEKFEIKAPAGYVQLEDLKTANTISYLPVTTALATVNGTLYYASFAKAVEEAPAGATVTLNQDVTVNQAVEVTKNLTINGNGKTLTANKCVGLYIKDNLGSLNVSDLKIQGVLGDGETAGEGSTGSFMGIGTYNGCYGVGKLELSNVVIDGFSYGMYFGRNPSGSGAVGDAAVSVSARNLTVQNCYIKGGYFEKLTDSTFTDCTFSNNGTAPEKVQNSFQTWMCGLDINLKNGSYQNISFIGCTFTGNGSNRGTALHIKARNDGSYGADTRLNGVTISGCTFSGNNATDTGASGAAFGPVVFGEPGKGNASPTGVSIQQGVTFTNNVAGVSVVTFDNADTATQIVANGEFTLPAPVKTGFTFKGWKNGENTYDAGTKVTVSANTTFTAVWEENTSTETPDEQKTYTATVNGQAVEYKAGETVSISAPMYSNGLVFSRWVVVSGNVTIANAYSNNTTFVMPEGNVEIQAVYTYVNVEPELPEYNPGHSGSTGGSSNNGGSSSTETVMPENGFGTDKNGNTFFFEDGEKVKGWVQDGDTWYYMDSHDGSMTTDGWAEVDGTWYNFAEDGKMNTGWVQDGETWYYLKDWGGMATGWQQVDGKWYYLKDSGAMATGWVKTGDTWYLLKDSGAMATGWQQVNGKWYYLKASGEMATGWVEVNGKWYYLKADGSMATNTTINGYYVNADGEWVK